MPEDAHAGVAALGSSHGLRDDRVIDMHMTTDTPAKRADNVTGVPRPDFNDSQQDAVDLKVRVHVLLDPCDGVHELAETLS